MGKGKGAGPWQYDPQSPMCQFKGPYRGEKSQGKGQDLYFQTREEMIKGLENIASVYTPMIWDEEKRHYVIDFRSAELLGI